MLASEIGKDGVQRYRIEGSAAGAGWVRCAATDFKVYGLMTLIPGETDAEVQALMDHLEAGVDVEGLADLARGYARKIATQVQNADLDGILLIVPDYISHLNQIGRRTLPLLAEYGIECSVSVGS